MFQYAFSLLLAKKYNCKLYCNEGLPNFSIPPVPFNSLQSSILTTRSIGNHYFNFNALNNFDGDIIMNSWAQKADYYTDSRDFLRNVFGGLFTRRFFTDVGETFFLGSPNLLII